MYLRTTKRKNQNGSVVTYFQLAHNVRHADSKKPVAQVLYNFGRADQLERDDMVRLCRSIARAFEFEVRDPLEALDLPLDDPKQELKGLSFGRSRQLGVVHLVEKLWERCGIGMVFKEIEKARKTKVRYERALLAMTANRLCSPESKLGVWDRWLEQVYLPSCAGLKLDHMYEAMDLLYDHSAEVEKAVFYQVADLMNLEVDLVFYDTTTVWFAVDEEDEDEEGLRRRGKGKEGNWEPQVVVALAVTREGVPVRSWVFSGNTSDVETVRRVREDLKGWKLSRVMFVGDSGMNSAANREDLARACGTYLLAVRAGAVKEVREDVLERSGRFKKLSENLYAREEVVGEGVRRRRYILCYNPREALRQKAHRDEAVAELEREVASHRDRRATAQWAIELLASGRYKRYLKVDDAGRISVDREAVRQSSKHDGRWVLITNDDTLSLEDAARGYKSMLVIERCFRSLKTTQIEMRPMYHWLPRRIEAHVKICVLALLLQRLAEIEMGQPWAHIRRALDEIVAIEVTSDRHRFVYRNEPGTPGQAILNKLKAPLPQRVLSVSQVG